MVVLTFRYHRRSEFGIVPFNPRTTVSELLRQSVFFAITEEQELKYLVGR